MNNFNFTGNLGRDCEVKSTSMATICKFAVAVKSGYGDKQKTNWVNCVIFGKRAEGKLPEYLLKGAQVAINGELSLNQYEKKDGTNGASLEVIVNGLDLIGGKSESKPQAQAQQRPQQPRQRTQTRPNVDQLENDFDVPF